MAKTAFRLSKTSRNGTIFGCEKYYGYCITLPSCQLDKFFKNNNNKNTRIHWLDWWIVRKQLGIMPTYHYWQNQGKLIMESWENDQKPQFGHFFDNFEAKYLEIENFSENQVLFKLKVKFRTNFRPKPKKIIRAAFEKKSESVWFWANLETFFANISKSNFFFSKIQLCDFSTFIVP